jgi:hypothetical protein
MNALMGRPDRFIDFASRVRRQKPSGYAARLRRESWK